MTVFQSAELLDLRIKVNKVLLIKPYYYGSHYDNQFLPTGLAYISESLSKANIQNKIIDMGLGYRRDELRKEIEEFEPQLIGISMMSFGYKHTYEMIKATKKSYPHISIVVGGPHLSTLRDKVLEECHAIDFGVTLEGEETIVELCQGDKPLPEIKGLLFRNSSRDIKYTGDRDFIKDLDKNAFPSYSKIELDRYYRHINIVTSRGCPYKCIYCPVNLVIGREFRVRCPKSVVDEIRYWYEKGYSEFGIADDNFTLIRKRVWDICDEIERQGITGLKISCGNGLRADKVDRKLLARMKEVGFESIAFGVEAGNNKVLDTLGKGEKIETIERAISDACDLDYKVTLFFLLGSPGETKSDIEDSIRLATRYPVYDVRFYNLIPFPNTKLYEWVKNNNYFRKDPIKFISEASHWVNDPIFETPELSISERKKLYEWANNKVKWYTFKVKREAHLNGTQLLFQSVGIPDFLSHVMAKIYWAVCFRKIVLEPFKEIISKIKKFKNNLSLLFITGIDEMDIATLILVYLNKIFAKPKRPCSHNPGPRDLIIATNPMTIGYFEIQMGKGDNYYNNSYHNHMDLKDKVILDLGCGLGGATFVYSKKGVKQAIGLEIERACLVAAKQHIKEKYGGCDKLVFLNGDAVSVPLKSNSVDLVVANDFMEHVLQPEAAIKEVLRVLKEGGFFFFEFPAYYSPRGAHMHYHIYTPWCHVFFSVDTLVKAARIIAAKQNQFWVFHSDWERKCRLNLNKLTIKGFLRILLRQRDYELVKLYFRSEYKLLQPLVYFKRVDEYLSHVECILRKEKGSRIQPKDVKNAYRKGLKKDWKRLRKRVLRIRNYYLGIAL